MTCTKNICKFLFGGYVKLCYQCLLFFVSFEPNRVRSNLCELPTSYVNNCQVLSNLSSQSKLSTGSDFMDYVEKGGRGPQSTHGDKLRLPKLHSQNGLVSQKVRSFPDETHRFPQALCFDTCTYFDKKHDDTDLQARYNREIETLRSKLRQLKGMRVKHEDIGRATWERDIGDAGKKSDLGQKTNETGLKVIKKVSVKTKRTVGSANSLKKVRPKVFAKARPPESSSEGSDG